MILRLTPFFFKLGHILFDQVLVLMVAGYIGRLSLLVGNFFPVNIGEKLVLHDVLDIQAHAGVSLEDATNEVSRHHRQIFWQKDATSIHHLNYLLGVHRRHSSLGVVHKVSDSNVHSLGSKRREPTK